MAEENISSPKTGEKEPAGVPELSHEDAEELIRAIGQVFAKVPLYGIKHKVTVKAIADCHRVFVVALDLFGEVSFQLMEESLMINTTAIDRRNPHVEAFSRHLAERDLSNFSLGKGVTLEMFTDLMEILNTKPEDLKRLGGFAQVAKDSGLDKVKSSSVIYKRVAEDEVVIAKDKAGETGGAADVKAVLSFLRGGVGGAPADEAAARNVRQLASSNAEKMGEVIVDAAQSRREDALDPEREVSLTQMVVDSLKRVYEQLSKDPSVKTQKGKKDLTRTLGILEEQVKERILAISGELSDDDAQIITGTVEHMTDELKIDALVAEYMKKRSAIDDNEKRLLKFMKAKGLDKLSESELEQRLLASGLTPESWKELLAKSGIEIGKGFGGTTLMGGIPVMDHLAELLSAIQASVSAPSPEAGTGAVPNVQTMLTEIDQEVKNMVTRTKVKIQNLVANAREDARSADELERRAAQEGKGLKMSRKKLFEILSEIVQELCQPLAVVSCSLDMLTSGSLGEISEQQVSMLKLAVESTDKLKVLTDNLLDIAGLPTSMAPDEGIQKALYDKG